MSQPRAVVLLSGGLDSSTVAAIAASRGYEVYALSFDYGQNHRAELDAAVRVARRQQVAKHLVASVGLRAFGGSALTSDIPVPKDQPEVIGSGIPVTYVPARNTVFLSLALAFAESVGSSDIFIGVNALDYSGYPDCRPEFIEAFERVANLGTKAGVEGQQKLRIHAPLIAMSKKEIVEAGMALGVDYEDTVTCYDPAEGGKACGRCDACFLRRKGFEEAGVRDPTRYRDSL